MSNRVKIQGNKIKILENIWDNDQMYILILLIIVKSSVSSKTLSVPLKKIAFVLHALKKNIQASKLSTLLSTPWEIPNDLRKKIILAHEKQYLAIKEVKSVISFSLAPKGEQLLNEIIKLDLIPETRSQIDKLSKEIKISELKNQDLIW